MCVVFQVAGGRNVPGALLHVAMKSIENARKMRYKSLNAYRKRFSMKPYSSFQDLTGETQVHRFHWKECAVEVTIQMQTSSERLQCQRSAHCTH